MRTIKKWFFPSALLTLLIGCGATDSGQPNETIPTYGSDNDTGIIYSGPAEENEDVINYKREVWDVLAQENRCGNCHIQGEQTPEFVRTDDINVAYASALELVDSSAPQLSLMVTKVATGHGCWENSTTACTVTMQNLITNWLSDPGASPEEIALIAPAPSSLSAPGASLRFPNDEDPRLEEFNDLYSLLRTNCGSCHAEDGIQEQQPPFFSSDDIDVAYAAIKTKINLNDAAYLIDNIVGAPIPSSRLLVRVRDQSHNCWFNPNGGDPCSYSSTQLQAAIRDYLSALPEPVPIDPSILASRASSIEDGIVASSGGRYQSDVIALYEFKSGEGTIAHDTSGVGDPLNLNFFGDVDWVGNWGIRLNGGRVQGSTTRSKKLHDLLKVAREYAIETWIIPANVTQEGPARIATYSGGADTRNFALGQTLYSYDFMNRSSDTTNNGEPTLTTTDVLQASLQHVVANYNSLDGRSLYVNGEFVEAADTSSDSTAGDLNDWDDAFAFAIGGEVDRQYAWEGSVRMLAIHSRVLTPDQITTNFDAGVGQKYFLLFGVSHLLSAPDVDGDIIENQMLQDAFVVFQVEVFDDHSYLFIEPFFIGLDEESELASDIILEGMRLGINGQDIIPGQAFGKMSVTISGSATPSDDAKAYSDNTQIHLASNATGSTGTVIPQSLGPDIDEFYLSFSRIGPINNPRIFNTPVPDLPEPEIPTGSSSPYYTLGLRSFDEIIATMSNVTNVPPSEVSVVNEVRRQLPAVEDIEGFVSSQQAGIMQLAMGFCTVLVEGDTSRRDSFFTDFTGTYSFSDDDALRDNAAAQDLIISALLKNLLGNRINNAEFLDTQPDETLSVELRNLINGLTNNDLPTSEPSDGSASTASTVIAACSSVLGSSIMLLQ